MWQQHLQRMIRGIEAVEMPWCIRLHRWGYPADVRILLEAISRLGNGGIWFLCGGVLWGMEGADCLPVIRQQAAGGALGWVPGSPGY